MIRTNENNQVIPTSQMIPKIQSDHRTIRPTILKIKTRTRTNQRILQEQERTQTELIPADQTTPLKANQTAVLKMIQPKAAHRSKTRLAKAKATHLVHPNHHPSQVVSPKPQILVRLNPNNLILVPLTASQMTTHLAVNNPVAINPVANSQATQETQAIRRQGRGLLVTSQAINRAVNHKQADQLASPVENLGMVIPKVPVSPSNLPTTHRPMNQPTPKVVAKLALEIRELMCCSEKRKTSSTQKRRSTCC